MGAVARTLAKKASSEFADLMDQLMVVELTMGIAQRLAERMPERAKASHDFQAVLDAIDRIGGKLEALRATLAVAT